MSATKLDMKKILLDAVSMERKSADLYDRVWAEFTPKMRQNVQGALVDILFMGDKEAFTKVAAQYKEDKTKLTTSILKDIQCFHRVAVAFSRRAKKERDVDADEAVTLVNAMGGVIAAIDQANPVSPADKKRNSREKNPEKLIQEAIGLVKHEGVKILLQQALIQMKLGLPQQEPLKAVNPNNILIETPVLFDTTEENDSNIWW